MTTAQHTVEKIGGTSMSNYEAVRDNIIIGKRKKSDLDSLVTWWPEFQEARIDGAIIMTTATAIQKKRKLVLEGRRQKDVK